MEIIKRSAVVKIDLPKMTEAQAKAFGEAEQKLIEAGITFDTGMNIKDGIREWFFDETTRGLVKTKIETWPLQNGKITRDTLDELITHELLNDLDAILDVLAAMKLIDISSRGYGTESDGWCWFERKPKREEKLEVLAKLGYDINRL